MSTERSRNRRQQLRIAFVLSVFLMAWLPAQVATGQSSGNDHERRANAEALFDEARTLMAMQRYAQACPKFAESQIIDPAVGTLLNLADCLEKLGRTASAWAEFRAAAAAASAKGQTDREQVARDRATRLERKLVRLAIVAPHDTEELEIRKNGAVVGRGSWGLPLPVDPGHYVVEASAPGKRSFRTEIDIPAKPGTQLTTIIPPLENSKRPTGHAQRIAGATVGTMGAITLVVGGVLGARAMQVNSASTENCRGNICNEAGVSLRSDARTFGNGATTAFIIGAAATTGGIITYVLAPKNPAINVKFGASLSGAGVFVGGAF